MTRSWRRRRWVPDQAAALEQWAQEQADREDDDREPAPAEPTGKHWTDPKRTR